jgi:beta-glucanase (GH16 family)
MKLTLLTILIVLLTMAASGPRAASSPAWVLTWSDEFNGVEGSGPDSTKWGFDIGGGGWGNNELEYYTNRTQNAFMDGTGNLAIKAIKENYTGTDGVTREYTSARLLTRGKFTQQSGRFEARIRIPFGQGIWPAFWMLGDDIGTVGWPTCGEIDIMENRGREPSISHASLHGPGYSGGNPLTGSYSLPVGQRFSDDFHVWAVEWEAATIRFYVDGNLFQTRTADDLPGASRWVFDHPFFMLLNVAVGGNFGGNPDATTTFPQTMLVDYVRVYRDSSIPVPLVTGVEIRKKDVLITGENFDEGADIVMNGEQRKTKRDDQDPSILVGKKLAKKIPRGGTVILQVKNADGTLSPEFSFTRPQ